MWPVDLQYSESGTQRRVLRLSVALSTWYRVSALCVQSSERSEHGVAVLRTRTAASASKLSSAEKQSRANSGDWSHSAQRGKAELPHAVCSAVQPLHAVRMRHTNHWRCAHERRPATNRKEGRVGETVVLRWDYSCRTRKSDAHLFWCPSVVCSRGQPKCPNIFAPRRETI